MNIIVTNAETKQYIKNISEEQLFDMCGKDQRMYDDYIKYISTHNYIKNLNEIWKIIENN